jgi:HSP20 family molecular chaperone IbpA
MESDVVKIISQDYDEDTNTLFVEVPLPGADKSTIDLQVHHDGFTLKALKKDKEEAEYLGAFSLCCPVDKANVTASYDEGLLKVRFPIHDSVDAPQSVKID